MWCPKLPQLKQEISVHGMTTNSEMMCELQQHQSKVNLLFTDSKLLSVSQVGSSERGSNYGYGQFSSKEESRSRKSLSLSLSLTHTHTHTHPKTHMLLTAPFMQRFIFDLILKLTSSAFTMPKQAHDLFLFIQQGRSFN